MTIGEDEPNNAGGDVIVCTRCQASSHVEFGYKENLVSRWNSRAEQPADPVEPNSPGSDVVAKLTELREFLCNLRDGDDEADPCILIRTVDELIATLRASDPSRELVERVRHYEEALGRIASNGFGAPVRDLCPKRDKDMLQMMDYARAALCPRREKVMPDKIHWLNWNGGECPVDASAQVIARYRADADDFDFQQYRRFRADKVLWDHYNTSPKTDVIAYALAGQSDTKGEGHE